MIVHLEKLYHYHCDRCQGYFAIADRCPRVGGVVLCPDPACSHRNVVESIAEHPLQPFHPPTDAATPANVPLD